MYYILDFKTGARVLSDFEPDPYPQDWFTGAKLADAPPNPMELTWDPEHESGVRASFYSAGPVLMTRTW